MAHRRTPPATDSSPRRPRASRPTLEVPRESSIGDDDDHLPVPSPSKAAPKDRESKAAKGGKSPKDKSSEKGKKDGPGDGLKPWHEPQLLESRARDELRVLPERVTLHTDPQSLPEKPRESAGLFEIVGSVARRALALGLASRESSFHVYVATEPEVMIEDDIVRFAERFVDGRESPPDIVYVHDFDHPEAPLPLVLPTGMGPELVEAMGALIDRLGESIPGIPNDDEVQEAQRQLGRELDNMNREVITGLESTAKTLGFGIRTVQGAVQTFPVLHGKPLSAEQFGVLDESTKRALGEAEERLTKEVERAARMVQHTGARFAAARNEALRQLADIVIDKAVKEVLGPFMNVSPELTAFLSRVRVALADDWDDFLADVPGPAGGEDPDAKDHDPEHATRLGRFSVNLLSGHPKGARPPVIYDTNPTYPNLFGYLERRARFGALLTDFTRIRPGSLHRASGGVLIVRAADVVADPIIWERMKRILRERRAGAEDPLGPLGLYATTLKPVPAPVRVRVVMVGQPELYAALLDQDPDFASLFRVKVEIEPSMPRTKERCVAMDSYLMAMAKEREWGTFDRGARARLLDLATRLAGDREKISLCLSPLEETAAFASALAAARAFSTQGEGPDGAPTSTAPRAFQASAAPPSKSVVTKDDVEIAWQERRTRSGAAERSIREMAVRGEVALDSTGFRVGVVNGLSVLSAGDVEFGQPMRITAVVALGREGIIDVEREAQLGGSIHTKGIAIVRGYLSRMFGQERPLSLRAQIAFEQSYGEIDGDSASSAELFGVLSALADLPVDQGIAITGSVNQLGEMQAIGGVCAKVEGFFELCQARGLTGHQGVLFPYSNLPHLVLREDVSKAIAAGKFHLYAIKSVTQGIEILTGVAAGDRDPSGRFPASSVFGRVERRLIEIAERLRQAESPVHDALESTPDVSSTDLGDGGDFRGNR